MKSSSRIFAVGLALTVACGFATVPVKAADGALNPEEGGLAQLTEALRMRPERAGFICWAVYEAQKGGQHAEALEALRQCANAGNEPSMILLAHAYENGLGVEPDLAHAAHWVRLAALRFYPPAQFHYGMALLEGRGVGRDVAQARFWLERAALGGDRDAVAALARFPGS